MTIACAKLFGNAKLKMADIPTGQCEYWASRQNPIVVTILRSCFSFITSKRSNKVKNRYFTRESVTQYYNNEQSTVDCAEIFATVRLGIVLTTMGWNCKEENSFLLLYILSHSFDPDSEWQNVPLYSEFSVICHSEHGRKINFDLVLYLSTVPWKSCQNVIQSLILKFLERWVFENFLVVIRIFVINKSLKGKCKVMEKWENIGFKGS